MNPKDLKVGDRIRLTGVVIASLGDYKIRLNGGLENTYITQSEADQCEIITPSAPAQGEWKPKVGEEVEGSFNEFDWVKGRFIGMTVIGSYCLRIEETDKIFISAYIRPIAKTVTMEEELYTLLSDPKQPLWYQKVLDWHTKHTPPQRKMPSTEEIFDYWINKTNDINTTIGRDVATVRHFGLDEKGGEG